MQTYALASGVVRASEDMIHMASKHIERMDATAQIADAGAVTYTAAQVLGGVIIRDCNGSARSDVLPTAALLIGALREDMIGQVVKCLIINDSDAAETITIVAGTDGAFTQIEATRIIDSWRSPEVWDGYKLRYRVE